MSLRTRVPTSFSLDLVRLSILYVYTVKSCLVILFPLFGSEIQSVGNVQTQPVCEMTIAKAQAIHVQQVIGHLEFSAVDCLLNSLNCCLNFHLVSFCLSKILLYHNGKQSQQLFSLCAKIQHSFFVARKQHFVVEKQRPKTGFRRVLGLGRGVSTLDGLRRPGRRFMRLILRLFRLVASLHHVPVGECRTMLKSIRSCLSDQDYHTLHMYDMTWTQPC